MGFGPAGTRCAGPGGCAANSNSRPGKPPLSLRRSTGPSQRYSASPCAASPAPCSMSRTVCSATCGTSWNAPGSAARCHRLAAARLPDRRGSEPDRAMHALLRGGDDYELLFPPMPSTAGRSMRCPASLACRCTASAPLTTPRAPAGANCRWTPGRACGWRFRSFPLR